MTKQGQLITVGVNGIPFLKHHGVMNYEQGTGWIVYHNTPRIGVTTSSYSNFMSSRNSPKLKDTKLIELTPNQVKLKYELLRQENSKFNLFTNNCEQFVDKLTGEKVISEQLIFYTFILASLIIFLVIQTIK
jgi:hypothetical protein